MTSNLKYTVIINNHTNSVFDCNTEMYNGYLSLKAYYNQQGTWCSQDASAPKQFKVDLQANPLKDTQAVVVQAGHPMDLNSTMHTTIFDMHNDGGELGALGLLCLILLTGISMAETDVRAQAEAEHRDAVSQMGFSYKDANDYGDDIFSRKM